jgi:hypothetical protein
VKMKAVIISTTVRTSNLNFLSDAFTTAVSHCNDSRIRPVVRKVCSADPKGSATASQGIRGYISAMATLKFTYF